MKKYLIYILLAMIPIGMAGGGYVGIQYQKGRELKAVEKQLKRDREKVAKLEKEKLESERKLRDQINKVRSVKGECLDTDLGPVTDGLWRR